MTKNEFDEIYDICEECILDRKIKLMFIHKGRSIKEIMSSLYSDDEHDPPRMSIPSVMAFRQFEEFTFTKLEKEYPDQEICSDYGDYCIQDCDFLVSVKIVASECSTIYIDTDDPNVKVKHIKDSEFIPRKLAVISDGKLHEVQVPICHEPGRERLNLNGFYSAIKLLLRTSNATWDDELFVQDRDGAWREIIAVDCAGNGQRWSPNINDYQDIRFRLVIA